MMSRLGRKALTEAKGWFVPRPIDDGFGQSWLDDLRYQARFWRCRKTAITWRGPTQDECTAHGAHAIISRFGDDTIAVAQVGTQHWIVRERDFWGWPDPPRFAFFVSDDGAIWAATDFNVWPTSWNRQSQDYGHTCVASTAARQGVEQNPEEAGSA